jgi:hypothetical protein
MTMPGKSYALSRIKNTAHIIPDFVTIVDNKLPESRAGPDCIRKWRSRILPARIF